MNPNNMVDKSGNSFLLELEETQFNQWKHHPVTEAFLKFLKDKADSYRRDLVFMWESNSLSDSDQNELRGRVLLLEELSNLPLVVIQNFYKSEEP